MYPPNVRLITNATRWDTRFFELAKLVSTWSEDTGRAVGAVVVGRAQDVRSIGFNGFPRKVSGLDKDRFSRIGGEKYYWFEHAERNAIYNAARSGVVTEGCTIYSTLFPCSDCVRAIIQSGISCLKTYSPPSEDPHYRRSFEVALAMAQEAGVEIELYDGASFPSPRNQSGAM